MKNKNNLERNVSDDFHGTTSTGHFFSYTKQGHARRQVELELYNVDIQDMFLGNRMEKLKNVLRNNLWRAATDLYYTLLVPASRPNRMPREKEGYGQLSTSFSILISETYQPIPNTLYQYFDGEFKVFFWYGSKKHNLVLNAARTIHLP
jgi:hypothetical protein